LLTNAPHPALSLKTLKVADFSFYFSVTLLKKFNKIVFPIQRAWRNWQTRRI
jgi:hypothetical protein